MESDIIFITGERFIDHPLCGVAILKRLLEKHGYTVGVIVQPKKESDITVMGRPKLFFGITSGSIDSLVRNYTPLKRSRTDDKNVDYNEVVPDRALIVYSNWVKKHFKDPMTVLGGTEASLRRFVHYDFWENRLRRPILFDSRADILVYGNGEKQILVIAKRIKNNSPLTNIEGTCIITKEYDQNATMLPSYEDVSGSKEMFCDMQNLLSNTKDLIQKIDNRYVAQIRYPQYTSQDLDKYYELDFSRKVPKDMIGFKFSVVTHRGCIGRCSFCSVNLIQGDRIISRSQRSILKEIRKITKCPVTGNIDDLGGPSANMYGMDCNDCEKECIDCKNLDRSNSKLIELLESARNIKGVKKIIIRSGIRFDLASKEYIKDIAEYHILDTLRIAPEHTNKEVLRLMNKDKGDLKAFINDFKETRRSLSYYFMTAHPGSTLKIAEELAKEVKMMKNTEKVQVFTPTPMTVSTCMYYTGMDPRNKEEVYVPYTYSEKKAQKRSIFYK